MNFPFHWCKGKFIGAHKMEVIFRQIMGIMVKRNKVISDTALLQENVLRGFSHMNIELPSADSKISDSTPICTGL